MPDLTTGLYLHFPFCKRRCVYCDFAVVTGREAQVESYVAAMIAEVRYLAAATDGPRLETVFVGGGTPTRTPAGVIAVLDAVRAAFPLDADAEITVEANPESATAEVMDAFAAAGVNRLSLGVQTLDDGRLARLGRLHDATQAAAAVQRARTRFRSLSLDLIFGMPGTTEADWREDLARAVALGPDHISAYCLTVEEGTPLAESIRRGKAPPPDDDLEARLLEVTAEVLPAHGFARYEISNFARPGCEARHNLIYWENRPCLGAGLGAAAFWNGVRWTNTRDFADYLARAAVPSATFSPSTFPPATFQLGPAAESSERLEPAAALGESILVGLRLIDGVDLEALGRRHGCDPEHVFAEVLSELAAEGLVERRGSRLRLSPRGLQFANRAMAAFTLPDQTG